MHTPVIITFYFKHKKKKNIIFINLSAFLSKLITLINKK